MTNFQVCIEEMKHKGLRWHPPLPEKAQLRVSGTQTWVGRSVEGSNKQPPSAHSRHRRSEGEATLGAHSDIHFFDFADDHRVIDDLVVVDLVDELIVVALCLE